MSVRLAKAMPHTSPEFWLKMQVNYDLSKAPGSPKSNRFRPGHKGSLPRPRHHGFSGDAIFGLAG